MRTIAIIFISAFIGFVSLNASAQAKIDKAIAEIENDANLSLTCTEKRDPETKKTYKISKVIKTQKKSIAQKVRDAIVAESKNAVEYTRTNNESYYVVFQDENSKMEYYLSKNESGSWIITVEIRNYANYPKSTTKSKKTKKNKKSKNETNNSGNKNIYKLPCNEYQAWLNGDLEINIESLEILDEDLDIDLSFLEHLDQYELYIVN